jgi:NAD(P)-dependent dehydrogenase (short-subunit alcohol dehydrogenase family)
MTLPYKHIVLTGASRGIGFELAQLLLSKGIKILGLGRKNTSIAKAKEILEPLGDITFLQADVAEKDTASRVSTWVESHWGILDVLINNAGIQQYEPGFLEEPLDLLERTMRVNVYGPYYLIRALIPLLEKSTSPRIINVSSGAGTIEAVYTTADMPSYRLSKFTLNGVTAFFSKQLKGKIAVNSLDPGWLKTDLGGPNAPGEPIDGAHRIIDLLSKPFSVTGKFWHGEQEIPF